VFDKERLKSSEASSVKTQAILVYGVGEIGSIFALGALKSDATVVPITRATDRERAFAAVHAFTPVVLSVPEAHLALAVREVPPDRKGDVVLVQNEMFPSEWHALGLDRPTIATMWVLRKKGQPQLGARPTTLHGPHAQSMAAFLTSADVAATAVDEAASLYDIALKYAFIVTVNALGVRGDMRVGEWMTHDPGLIDALLTEGVALGAARAGIACDTASAIDELLPAMHAFGAMPARGRTARERVDRAIACAATLGVRAPTLRASLEQA
jgi:hypothetical protein